MLDATWICANKLHLWRFSSTPASADARGRRPPIPGSRILAVAGLAALVFILAALAGPHLVEHLLGAGGDPDHCTVCAALHGARFGVAMAPAAPLPGLPVVGSPTLRLSLSAPVVPVAASSSRAPPLAA